MQQIHLTVASNGRMVIPASMRSEIGLAKGGEVVAHVENGTVVLEPLDQAILRVQKLVAKFVPAGVSLADEVILERHAAAKSE